MKEIKLSQGKVAFVDDEDFDELNKFKWRFNSGYALRHGPIINGKRNGLYMHREIMKTAVGVDTDHIDHNKLNNQKANLRVCTTRQNSVNRKKHIKKTSTFKGVYVHRLTNSKYKYYGSQIQVEGKKIKQSFPYTPEGEIQAAEWYNRLAKKHFGEFAYFNVIPEH